MGIGPGNPMDRTIRAQNAIVQSKVVAGYSPYLEYIADLIPDKEVIATGMTREEERCRSAIERAKGGATVALVSSGDPGVYGMAGLALEMAARIAPGLEIEIVPGVSAASAAAAAMGAPLMLDYAVISLSDLLVPWAMIRGRLEAIAAADMVAALYNPRSKKRVRHLEEAVEIFLCHRTPDTPVGIGTALGMQEGEMVLTTLRDLLSHRITMRIIVLIGNTRSRIINNRFITPRGYEL